MYTHTHTWDMLCNLDVIIIFTTSADVRDSELLC